MYFRASCGDARSALAELAAAPDADLVAEQISRALEVVAMRRGRDDETVSLRFAHELGLRFCRWLEGASYRAAQDGRADVAAALGRLRASARS